MHILLRKEIYYVNWKVAPFVWNAYTFPRTPLYNMEHTDELSIIGHTETLELAGVVSSGAYYTHRCCIEFSPPFQDQTVGPDEDKDQIEETRIRGIVTGALMRKCAFCNKHGASIPCKVSTFP